MSIFGKIDSKAKSRPFTVSAPVGGLNGRDPLADMDPKDAYVMDNVYPRANAVEVRRGCAKHINTPLEGPTESLHVYTGAGAEKLLAWAGTKAYDVSGATPTVLDTDVTEPYVNTTMFSNAADNAQFLIICNGADLPKSYNGTAIADLTMTGIPSPNDLIFPFTFKGRLFFVADDMLGAYYLPVGQIQGALSFFDLGQVSKLGGKLIAIASYSDTAGETPNDFIIFITSRGECIVYDGSDPSNASAWRLVGRYFASTPIGSKCAFNLNGQLIILTLDGAVPFSEIRRTGDGKSQGVATREYGSVTTKLGRYISELNVNASAKGWEGIQYPRGGWLVLNTPASLTPSGEFYQFVMNVSTGSWCRFVNWNAMCFAVFNDRLYFGRYDGYVMLADEGRNDDGDDILINVKQAYNYFTSGNEIGNVIKKFQWAQLFVSSDGTPPISGSFSVNFNEKQPESLTGIPNSSGAEWDEEYWDVASWGTSNEQRTAIITLNRGGFNGSLWLRASLSNISFEWFATQYVLEPTGNLLI